MWFHYGCRWNWKDTRHTNWLHCNLCSCREVKENEPHELTTPCRTVCKHEIVYPQLYAFLVSCYIMLPHTHMCNRGKVNSFLLTKNARSGILGTKIVVCPRIYIVIVFILTTHIRTYLSWMAQSMKRKFISSEAMLTSEPTTLRDITVSRVSMEQME